MPEDGAVPGDGAVLEGEAAAADAPERSVLGAPRSLFDSLRPSRVELAGGRLGPVGGMALAALQQPEVTGGVHRPTDTVVQAGRAFGRPAVGWELVEPAPRAPAIAYGMAAARRRRAPTARTWCLLEDAALADGRALEALTAIPSLPATLLTPVAVVDRASAGRVEGLLAACGWEVRTAANDDAWDLLSALDRVCRPGGGSRALVAIRPAARADR